MSETLSYAAGPSEPPIPGGTIGDWLDRTVARFADRMALVLPWQDGRWTSPEPRDRADPPARVRPDERVCAWARVRGPVEPTAVIDRCRGKIAHHKVPALVRIIDEFPMTVTGKVQKFAMRDAEIQPR